MLTKLIEKTVDPIETDLEGWRPVEGSPTMKTWIEYTSPDESMITGCWEATPGTYQASYASWEFIHILEGEVTILPEGGDPQTLKAGDTAMLEADFVGTWTIHQKVYKHFAIKLR